jgi:hypothetical protein
LGENDGMENLVVDAMILICILGYYCRREGIGWFHLPLEHMITNLLSQESSEILKMLLQTIMLSVTPLLLQCDYKGITEGSAYVFSFLSTIGRLTEKCICKGRWSFGKINSIRTGCSK